MRRTWTVPLLLVALACRDGGSPDDSGLPPGDADGDGHALPLDCDDEDARVHPGAPEVCDGVDNDCDGLVDGEDDGLVGGVEVFFDEDGDGWGGAPAPGPACAETPGLAPQGGDCDDGDAALNPGADEVCDGVDNDCDDLVDDADEGLVSALTLHEDLDGDGFGDPATAAAACRRDGDRIEQGGDCDDADPEVRPGADEVCDGVDNDCDPGTSEAGLARFTHADGREEDLTDALAAGSAEAPAHLDLTSPGVLRVCAGRYHARLSLTADVEVIGPAGSGATTLDAAGSGSGVLITDDGLTLRVSGLTLEGGTGTGSYLGLDMGGGLRCDARATLTLDDVVVQGAVADLGAGLFIGACEVEARELVLRDNVASFMAGGVAVAEGELTLRGGALRDNRSENGGALAAGLTGAASVRLIDVVLDGNEAAERGGALLISNAELSCEGSEIARSRAGLAGGGAFLTTPTALFEGLGCDLGEGSAGNSPDDIAGDGWSVRDPGPGRTFTCSSLGCED